MKQYKGHLFAGIFLLLIILGMGFATALGAPTGAHFEDNVSADADNNGIFTVNWTSPGAGVQNYSIFVYVNGSFSASYLNNSVTGRSFVNNTEETNYTYHIAASQANGTLTANSTNISIFIDTTPPTVSLPHYTNATIKINTEQLTLNISLSDAGSKLLYGACLVDVNGTNQTIAISGLTASSGNGWCNSTTISLAGLSDGNRTINVWVNNSAGVFKLNNSFIVRIDGAVPTATATCTREVYEGADFPCGCSGTDTISSIATISGTSNSPDGIGSPVTIGTFTYTCTVTDNVGNSGSDSETYTILRVGGGAAQGPSERVHSWTKITPGAAIIMKDFSLEFGVKQIEISVNNEAQNVKITVTKYDEKPAEVSVSKTGKIYQYVQIDAQNLADKLNKANVQFKVAKTWTSTNGLDKNEIAVHKFDESNNKWNQLKTIYSSEDSSYYYYDVELDSFSYFAIAEGSAVSDTETIGTTIPKKQGNWTWLWVLIIVVVLIAGWYFTKKKRR